MARSVGGDLKHAQIVRPGAVLGSVSSAWTAGPAAIAATGVRQGQGRQLPLGRRQAAARRRLRLRRRLPPRQSLGRPALQRRHRSWQRSSPRHPYVARAWLYVIWHYRQDRTATTPRSTKPSSGC